MVTPRAGEPAPPSDEELLARLADDHTALGPLYDRHSRLVYGLALAILANADEAQDLTQEVFLSLCDSRLYDPARGSVGAFLTTLVRSRAIDRLRRRTRRVRLLRAQWEAAPPLEPAAMPQDRIAEAQSALRVLEMSYYKGLTQAEIAEDLGIPLGTVKSWCRRGLIALKRSLADLVDT